MTLKLNGSTSGYVTIDAPAVAGTTAITLPAVSGGSFVVSDSSGNVGIGTNTPATKLDVAGGGIMMRVGTSAGGNNLVQAYTDVSALGMWAGGAPRFYSTGSMRFSVNSTVGTSSPTGYTDAMTLDSSGNCGIGTTAPGSRLQVNSSVAGYTTSLADSVTTATLLLKTNSGDSTLTSFGGLSGGAATIQRSNGAGTTAYDVAINPFGGNLLVGTTTAVGTITTRGANSSSTGNCFQANNSSAVEIFRLRNDGAVYTGTSSSGLGGCPYNNTTAAAANMVVGTGGDLQRSTSSLKYKTDVKDSTHGLAEVLQLRPVTYKGKNDGDIVFGGLIAEEVDAVGLKEFVQYAEDGSPDALAYGNMVSLLVAAIKELKAELDALKAKVGA